MALCSPTTFLSSSPSAIPAKKLTSHGFILRTLQFSSSRKTFPSIPHATPPQRYVYPDPIPEFALAETKKFRGELMKKLSEEKGTFGADANAVVNVCTKIFSEFLHKEYGGPGTLLVEPFTYMMVALKERKLPGAALAARASLIWAQNNVDEDWEKWNSKPPK